MSINLTAADVLTEVAGMIKQSKAWANGCKLTWKNADVSVRLYQVGNNGKGFRPNAKKFRCALSAYGNP